VDATAGNTIVTSTNPAKRGDVLELFANGLGPVVNPQSSGDPASSTVLSKTTTDCTVTIGGVSAKVDFCGMAPGYVGLYQINATVPSNAPTGSQPVVISVGGVSSPSANLPVQ
jgi:uncharacterized protein (TIGR03437 family)